MSWINRIFSKSPSSSTRKANVPEGVWTKCTSCEQVLYSEELKRNLYVCPKCGHHMRIDARERLLKLLDEGSSQEIAADLEPKDILKFKDLKKYKDRISAAQKETGEKDALITMTGTLYNIPIVVAASNFAFMGGSMGSVVGAKFVKAAEKAIEMNCPFVCFSASGGARMQEALFSLMQMAKTSAVLAQMREKGVPFISVLTDPTLGGVSASFAMLGDLNIAEPKALIGFAGPRVIEGTIHQQLPDGFQRAEFQLKKGFVDCIVPRIEQKHFFAVMIDAHMNPPFGKGRK